MHSPRYYFVCKHCNAGFSRSQFNDLEKTETPYLPNSNIFQVEVKCPDCGNISNCSTKGRGGQLYPGLIYVDENMAEEDVINSFDFMIYDNPQEDFAEPHSQKPIPESFDSATKTSEYEIPHLNAEQNEEDIVLPQLQSPQPSESSPQRDQNKESATKQLTEKQFTLTDTGNAKRLVHRYGSDICYNSELGWCIWTGKIWKRDAENIIIMRMAKETAEAIMDESSSAKDEKAAKNIKSHSLKSQNTARINGMIKLAKSEESVWVETEKFDSSDWLINLENGVIDLKRPDKGLLPHSRNHYFRRVMPVSFDPKADCPAWHKFLNKIMDGNQNLIQFLQRVVGYSLTGDVSEQSFFVLYGTGANGKSTFIETLNGLMGDFALTADFTTFSKTIKNIRNDLARLNGSRVVSAVEGSSDAKIDETTLKKMTGSERLTVRFLFQEEFQYYPKYKVFLVTNHKPIIEGGDHAIWRRVMFVPFNVRISEQERQGDLANILQKEYSGILNWAIQGCMQWQKEGLNPPQEIRNEIEKYKENMDIIGNFIRECCFFDAQAKVSKKDLYQAYNKWCEINCEKALEKKTFGAHLISRDIEDGKSGNVRIWKGIQLNNKVFENNPNDVI